MSEPFIRRCPFCGGEARLTEHFGLFDGVPFKVSCRECGASMADFEREEVIAAWNRRAGEPPHGDCVKCEEDPDFSCQFCGEPCGCNNRELGERVRKEARGENA